MLRGVLRKGSILETNVAQTIASAVNTSNSGVIFTVPVLLLIGIPLAVRSADFWLITAACIAGGFLGTAFIIPLRKQMLDIERLRFPSATAVASILKSPGAGSAKALVLVVGDRRLFGSCQAGFCGTSASGGEGRRNRVDAGTWRYRRRALSASDARRAPPERR